MLWASAGGAPLYEAAVGFFRCLLTPSNLGARPMLQLLQTGSLQFRALLPLLYALSRLARILALNKSGFRIGIEVDTLETLSLQVRLACLGLIYPVKRARHRRAFVFVSRRF